MTCAHCQKDTDVGLNYCSWHCQVEHWKLEGGIVYCPNGLPIRCLRADGAMLEHEHADHPDYKFPVTVEFTGKVPEGLPEWDHSYDTEIHALIYTDASIAVTLHECTYCMWYLGGSYERGEYAGKKTWYSDGWRLSAEAVEKCRELTQKCLECSKTIPSREEE